MTEPQPLSIHLHALRECLDCGLFQTVPPTPAGSDARCLCCDAILRRVRHDALVRPLALALAGLALYAVAISLPFMGLELDGFGRATTLPASAAALDSHGAWQLATVLALTVLVMPGVKLLVLASVLLGLRLKRPPRLLVHLFRAYTWIGPWAMVEVYLLGVLVAYSRLSAMATVQLGPALYALGGLMLVTVMADIALDRHAIWEALDRRGVRHGPTPQGALPIACPTCSLVSRTPGDGRATCPRCGTRLRQRKRNSLVRTWSLIAAAAIMYVPANLYPVMLITYFGRSHPSTILAGVQELAAAGEWPLALLVFAASITVPLLKLCGLVLMLLSVHLRWAWRLRDRTRLYRIVEVIGRWSMIDIFMLSLLVALVRMGLLASVQPDIGAVCFAAVVILTMLAAASFDPRLMWDAAAARQPRRPVWQRWRRRSPAMPGPARR